MKICSVCRQCYDDSVTICAADDSGLLVQTRDGNRLTVEGYRLEFRLEQDSPAGIYKATHLASEKNVLIRFIKNENLSDELQKEIETVAAINHPNLARVFEFGKTSDDEFYVVSEDIAGQNLKTFLETNSPLKERFAIKIARQIAEGLEELHSKNIFHRAVSPANIYFTNSESDDFEVKLQNYDFGGLIEQKIGKGSNGIDAKTEIFRYFSPEQLSGEKVEFKSDHFSLGIVFYEMLLGRSPYAAINPPTILNYVFDESDVEKLHFDLRALIAYTLRQSLQQRVPLRPPTTNNLARQYRHLELIATPPDIGVQKNKQPKQRKNVSSYQPIQPKPVEENFVEEAKISAPAFVEPVIQPDEIISANAEDKETENFPPEIISESQDGKDSLELVSLTEGFPQVEIQNIAVEENNFENDSVEKIEFSDSTDKQIEDEKIEFLKRLTLLKTKIFRKIFIKRILILELMNSRKFILLSRFEEISEPEFVEEETEKESPLIGI